MLFLSYFSHVTNWWYISTCLVFGLCVAAWLFLTNGFVTTLSLYFLRYISIYLCMPSYGILFAFLTLAAWYAVSVCVTVVCPSVRLSVPSIDSQYATSACSWFPAARARAADIDRYLSPVPEPGLRPASCCDPRDEDRRRLVTESFLSLQS